MPPSDPDVSLRHPHLQHLRANLDTVTAAAARFRSTFSDEQLRWQPSPDAWGIAACFDHLYVTGELYYPRIQEAIGRAKTNAEEPYRPSFFARKFIDALRPDSTRRLRTLRIFRPEQAPTDAPALDRFLAQQRELVGLLQQADGVNLNSGTFASPATRLVRFTIGAALTMLITHQQRHLAQAQRVQQAPGFPAS